MKIEKCIENVSTLTELKRIASPYVIDYRGLSEEEIKAAVVKTAPQYYYEENVSKAIEHFVSNNNRAMRIIAPYLLQHVVLQNAIRDVLSVFTAQLPGRMGRVEPIPKSRILAGLG